MAEQKQTGSKQTKQDGSNFKKFIDSSKYVDGKPLVSHLSRVVEKMTKEHLDTPVKHFEDVSALVGQSKQKATDKRQAEVDSDDEEDLGYLRDKPEQLKAYVRKTTDFMVGVRHYRGLCEGSN